MNKLVQIVALDAQLQADIAASMAEAAARSGDWLACRPGCTACCLGPFAITALDAMRLREGLRALSASDPTRALSVRERVAAYVAAVSPVYPGDAESGALWDLEALPEDLDSLPCPVLDPAAGTCDLYAWRPVTCRTFGPVTRVEGDAFGACELCYEGATAEEMAACAVEMDREGREAEALQLLEASCPEMPAQTLVAFALAVEGRC